MIKYSKKTANILALVFWLVSLALSFLIRPGTAFIWLPDALLLLGFLPLLIAFKARWLWLVFGICNMFIGFVLLVSQYLPQQALSTYHLLAINTHMKLYHSYWSWLLIGGLAILIAIIIFSLKLFAFVFNRQLRS